MAKYTLNMDKYAQLARLCAAEGSVLLKNEHNALPLKQGSKVSVFGRIAFNYYKSGTGSGGLVNTSYVIGILDALKNCPDLVLNEELMGIYEEWLKDHPFDKGQGWGQEPWCQEEMPLTDDIVKAAAASTDTAIIVIGRTAGEDQDTKAEAGSYYLTDAEKDMLAKVCASFEKSIVLLNTGNIIDMKWVEEYHPASVLYVWQGGQEGGNGVLDVLTGAVNPCGKLTDTVAANIEDYPSTANFGDEERNFYQEDVYVGYRYFETFAPEKVLYPFGFGLSYTDFSVETSAFTESADSIVFDVSVTNTGSCAGKEVIQIYGSAPQGVLGKPVKELKAYNKTPLLAPSEKAVLHFELPKSAFASYDDGGLTGHKSAFVLEAGTYSVYAGTDVRTTLPVGTFEVSETTVTEQLSEALAPALSFDRLRPVACGDHFTAGYEAAPLRTASPSQHRQAQLPKELAYTGDLGYKLADVYDKKVDMDTFIAQLSDEDLTCIIRGEGMCSPKVTPGTAAAFGGVTESLKNFGIPVGCCSDGPSGIRMDCGTIAFSMPNGTCLGCTFNDALVGDLFAMAGLELRKNNIDTLLGPGMNIHRNPLNGRNFEYVSEDPYVTGMIAAAQLKGMATAGVTGTIKHFAGNNQEFRRRFIDSVVSERALREIYLKCFEIAVKEGGAYSIMTTYGALNGLWTAGNYDLDTEILRNQWGYDGIVMTDWWADINEEGGKPSQQNTGIMVQAQNDLFMVVQDSASNSANDTALEDLTFGKTTRGEFQRCAANICNVLMRSPVMDRFLGRTPEDDLEITGKLSESFAPAGDIVYYEIDDVTTLDMSHLNIQSGSSETFGINCKSNGIYTLSATLRASENTGDLSQMSLSVFYDNTMKGTFNINGTDKQWQEMTMDMGVIFGPTHYIKLFFSMTGMEVESITFKKVADFKLPF